MVRTIIEYTDGEEKLYKQASLEESLEFIKKVLVDQNDNADKITIDLTGE